MPNIGSHKAKRPSYLGSSGGSLDISLTMSYFHTGTRTIIGAEAFHFPVRDGKEWDHLAMVIRLNWLPGRHATAKPNHGIRIGIMTASTEGGQTPSLTSVKVIGSSLTGN